MPTDYLGFAYEACTGFEKEHRGGDLYLDRLPAEVNGRPVTHIRYALRFFNAGAGDIPQPAKGSVEKAVWDLGSRFRAAGIAPLGGRPVLSTRQARRWQPVTDHEGRVVAESGSFAPIPGQSITEVIFRLPLRAHARARDIARRMDIDLCLRNPDGALIPKRMPA